MEIKSHLVQDIEFKVYQSGSGRPVIFLHGYGGGVKDWEDLRSYLGPNIHAQIISLKPLFTSREPISFSEQVSYLNELLDKICPLGKEVLLISTSYGSALAWSLSKTTRLKLKHVFINPMPLDPMRWMKSLELRVLAYFAKSKWLLSLFLSTRRGQQHLRCLGAIFGMGVNSVPKKFDRRKRLLVFKAISRFLWLVQNEDWEKVAESKKEASELLLIYSEDDPLYYPDDFKQYKSLFKQTQVFRMSRAPHLMMSSHAPLIASLLKAAS